VIDRTTFREAGAVLLPGAESTRYRGAEWQHELPVLRGASVTLREIDRRDAPSLVSIVTSEEVARFISPPPPTIEGFERFIEWTQRERSLANGACFAVVPHGLDQAIGLFQLRRLDDGFETAEWGFVLGSGFWNRGLFMASAQLVLEFAFETIGVHRLEARAATANPRGNGALRKVGAICEAIVPNGLEKDGQYLDQALWTLQDDEWRLARRSPISVH
jgi:RimJ/RimL family protein N-acetyltransferase